MNAPFRTRRKVIYIYVCAFKVTGSTDAYLGSLVNAAQLVACQDNQYEVVGTGRVVSGRSTYMVYGRAEAARVTETYRLQRRAIRINDTINPLNMQLVQHGSRACSETHQRELFLGVVLNGVRED